MKKAASGKRGGGAARASATFIVAPGAAAYQLAVNAAVERIALNMDQVEAYRPPPNFAKLTDTRANAYVKRYGGNSWELDALEPTVLSGLIEETVTAYRDERLWDESVRLEEQHRADLRSAAKRWGDVTRYLKGATHE